MIESPLETLSAEEEAAFEREARLEREAIRTDGKGGALYSFPQTQEDPHEIETAVSFIRSDALPVKAINWIWHGYLALGKLHVLCGRPGCGKTSIAVSFAAAVTCGAGWPDNSWSESGDVVIWSGEDDPADTLIPKLIKSGAELSRVHFVDKTKDIDGTRAFDPSTDMDALRR